MQKIFKLHARQAGAFEQIPMVVCQRRAMVAGKFCSELLSKKIQGKVWAILQKNGFLVVGFV